MWDGYVSVFEAFVSLGFTATACDFSLWVQAMLSNKLAEGEGRRLKPEFSVFEQCNWPVY